MSTEIEVQGQISGVPSLPAVENKFEGDFGTFTSGLYLPRLQLEGSSSRLVKTKKITAGSYAFVTGRDQFEDLGEKIDIAILTYRSKALDIRNKKKPVASFNKDSAQFKTLVALAQNKTKGIMYGLEFLVFVPSVKGEQKFGTLFMGNPTMRVAAKNFAPILQAAKKRGVIPQATLSWEPLSNEEYNWEGPTIFPCTSPLSEYPSGDDMTLQMEAFNNPSEAAEVEMVAAEAEDAEGDARR